MLVDLESAPATGITGDHDGLNVPGVDPALAAARALLEGKLAVALTADAALDRIRALDAVVRHLRDCGSRTLRAANPDGSPLHLRDLSRQIAAASSDSGSDPIESFFNALTQRQGDEERVVLLIDDAHTLRDDTLEYLSLILSATARGPLPLQIVLCGSTALAAALPLQGALSWTSLAHFHVEPTAVAAPPPRAETLWHAQPKVSEPLQSKASDLFSPNAARAIPAPPVGRRVWGMAVGAGLVAACAGMFVVSAQTSIFAQRADDRPVAQPRGAAPEPGQTPVISPVSQTSVVQTVPRSDAPQLEAVAPSTRTASAPAALPPAPPIGEEAAKEPDIAVPTVAAAPITAQAQVPPSSPPEPERPAVATQSGPSGTMTALPKVVPPAITALLTRGDALLAAGDVATARLLYERAAALNSGRGAIAAGTTYDQRFLDRMNIHSIMPDAREAAAWYSRGVTLGDKDGTVLLEGLPHRTGG